MDVNFHYFAVKTIALFAGFKNDDAQIIAAYSQFVDDYNVWRNYSFEEVPEYARSLVKSKSGNRYVFYSVTTGFTSLSDTARLSISKYQREIVVPFHFIPIKPLKEFSSDCSRSEYRTAPADIKGSFLIKDLLDDARNKYRENAGKYELMRIGILLHIFADTYAHQNFSGFWGWENFSYLKRVTDNFQGDQDITKNYKPEFYKGICAVGHAEVGHAPDDTYASFEMSMAENERQKSKNSYALQFNRSNTQVFADAAKQIFTYLYLCCQNKEPVEEQWNKLREVLVQGFAFKDKDENALARAWCGIYNGLYRYDKKELWDNKLVMDGNSTPDLRNLSTSLQANGDLLNYDDISVIKCKTADEDFFRYNLIAKEIRDKIIEP